MGCFLKKILFLGILSYLVFFTVDFSTPEIKAACAHLESSLDNFKNHKYYNEYVIPVKSQLDPFISGANEKYISPSYTKVSHAAVDKYHVYLSRHIDKVVDKVVSTSVYDKIISQKPQMIKYYQLANEKAKYLNTFVIRYILIGLNDLKVKSNYYYTFSKPLVIDFYHNKAIPCSKTARVKSVELAIIAKAHMIEFYKFIKLWIFEIYSQHIVPFYHEQITPFFKSNYNQYLKKYIDPLVIHVTKYYNLLRVGKIITFSRKCFSSAYDRIFKYDKSKATTRASDSTVATSDSPTNFEEETEVPIIEVTPDSPGTEDDKGEATPETFAETETVSSYGSVSRSSGDSLETTKDEENAKLTLSLSDEIFAWRSFIDSTVENFFKNFEKSITTLEKEKLDEAKPHISSLLSNLSQISNTDYAYINRVIYDINSTSVILENGEEAELDPSGKLIDHKISRQEFRDLLKDKSEVLKELADEVNTELKSYVSQIEELLEVERKLIVDIFEEFAEVSINEFSKKMMYSTFSNSFKKINQEGLEDDDENFSDWREYVKAKNYLIKKREELIQTNPDFELIDKLISEVAFTLRTLEQDSGNGFAILRAKANLAFQAREARERAVEEAIEAGEKITKTLLTTVTASIGSDGEVTSLNEITQVDIPVKSFVELSKEIPEPSEEIKVDIPERSFVQLSSEVETPASTKEVPVESEDEDLAEPSAEQEVDDQDIIEHKPDSGESEHQEDIVEHKPDLVEDSESVIPEDTPDPETSS